MRLRPFILALVIISCRNQESLIQIPNESNSIRTAILDSIAAERHLRTIYLRDTTIGGHSWVEHLQESYSRFPKPHKGDSVYVMLYQMVPGLFEIASTRELITTQALHTSCNVKTTNYAEAAAVSFGSGNAIISLSQVGFTPDSLYALVFVDEVYGPLNGRAGYVLFKKENAAWKQLRYFQVFVY
jgi:hypothetical protein